MTVFSRIAQKDITVLCVTGSNEIIITPSGNDVQIIKVSFNKWRHLELDSGNEIIKLKLVSKETEKVPVNPLKVVLLKFAGEI